VLLLAHTFSVLNSPHNAVRPRSLETGGIVLLVQCKVKRRMGSVHVQTSASCSIADCGAQDGRRKTPDCMRGLPGALATVTLYIPGDYTNAAAVTVRTLMIGIQSALASEIDIIRERMTNTKVESAGGVRFAVGDIGGSAVVAVAGGVGKARASACAQSLIDTYRVESIIMCGVAGCLNPTLKIGDIVISRQVVEYGGISGTASTSPHEPGLTPDAALVQTAKEACAKTVGENCFVTGTILTCDRPVLSRKRRRQIGQLYTADCVEMEGAAVARVCVTNHVPFVVVRAISDRAGPLGLLELRRNLRTSSRRAQEVVLKLLSILRRPYLA